MKTQKGFFMIFILFIGYLNAFCQTSDTIPPMLNSINFVPQQVNNGDSLEIRLNITDNLSGVNFIALFFRSPSGSQYAEAQGSSTWIRQNDSIFIAKIKMNDWAENGNWYISQVQITDSANNTYVDFTSTNDTIATFLVNGVSSVLNLDSYVNIELYPNPSSGIVYLSNSLNIKSLSIFDYSGKIVTNINEMGKNYLDLTNLTKGLYIFHIVTDKNLLIMRKILIE